VCVLRGFLSLTGYYRKFIRDYAVVARPLTQLLKREAFCWPGEAKAVFVALKQALTTGPALQLLDFDAPFIVNCDASGSSFGIVLDQYGEPITFYSRPVAPQHAKLAAYERKLISLVKAVRHWRPYLWACPFVVRTDHYSLKFLLHQHLCTIPQHTWVSKLFGYDFGVEFSSVKTNTVVDALLRHDEEIVAAHAISSLAFNCFDKFRYEAKHLADIITAKEKIAQGEASAAWSIVDGFVLHDRCIFVTTASAFGPSSSLRRTARAMKASRRPCNASGPPSIPERPALCASTSRGVRSASETRQSISILPVCCTRWRSRA